MEGAPRPPEKLITRPELGYILPFGVYIGFLALGEAVRIPQAVRFLTVLAILLIFSRGLLPARPARLLSSILLGVGVFFLWIAPDALIPGYRTSILFSNPIVGLKTTTLPADQISPVFLVFRILGSVVTVPIIEELFWRGWMMRWIAAKNFTRIPVGTYNTEAFWVVAALFASEHGPYWDVGLLTGVIYNLWAMRTRNLTDCVIAHAVTNACLAIYVIGWGQWQYWM